MDNIETGKGGLNVLLWQICNLRTIEVSKAIFGTKGLNIFATGCSMTQLPGLEMPFSSNSW